MHLGDETDGKEKLETSRVGWVDTCMHQSICSRTAALYDTGIHCNIDSAQDNRLFLKPE